MGMYTELSFCAELTTDLPKEIENTLKWMIGEIDRPDTLPEHELFNKDRCDFMLRGGSAYFPYTIDPIFKKDGYDNAYRLVTKSNIKNYEGEIQSFLDWIEPYIAHGVGARDMFAVVCYEEQSTPNMYYLY